MASYGRMFSQTTQEVTSSETVVYGKILLAYSPQKNILYSGHAEILFAYWETASYD